MYRTQIEEKHREVVRFSQELQKANKEKEALQEEIKKLQEKLKLTEKYMEKYQDDVKAQFELLKKAFSIPQFVSRIQNVATSIYDIDKNILSLVDFAHLIPYEFRLQAPKESLLQAVTEIEEALKKLEKSVLELRKAVKNITG